MKLTLISILLFSHVAYGKLLDKTIAIVNDDIITLSQVSRIQKNLSSRVQVSPMLYSKLKKDNKSVALKKVQSILIRKKLAEIGYVISDDQIEQEITSIEKSQRITREALLNFLKGAKLTFEEFFEIKREETEYRIFVSNIIRPLVTISEQDIKNSYYKNNKNNKRLNFKYTLVDFSLPKKKFKRGMLSGFNNVLVSFQKSGVLPSNYKDVDTNLLENLNADGLTNSLKKALKNTDEGSFSKPLLIGGSYHVFFIKSKDLTESSSYQEAKEEIRLRLFNDSIETIAKNWFDSESKKYFVKFHI
jgi:peptidyl-prolyl cis-trans isomerase SurA